MEKQKKGFYTIGDVCEKIKRDGFNDFHSHNLRYIEKVLELEIRRDEYFNRVYIEKDIELIETVLKLKGQGLNYNAIKKFLSQCSQPEDNDIHEDRSEEVFVAADIDEKEIAVTETDANMESFKAVMSELISQSFQDTVVPKLNELQEEIHNLKSTNSNLKNVLEKQSEEHFRQIDAKLTKWREESKKKKGFLSRLLG